MAVISKSGTISSNETWDLIANTYQITGSLTISSGAVVTASVASAGTPNPIEVTGNYKVNIGATNGSTAGGWVFEGTTAKQIVYQSSNANPTDAMHSGFDIYDVVAGSKMKNFTIRHSSSPIYWKSAYTTDNLDFDIVSIEDCQQGLLWIGGVNTSLGQIEMKRLGQIDRSICSLQTASYDLAIDTLVAEDCICAGLESYYGGRITIGHYVAINCQFWTGAFSNRGGSKPTYTATNIWMESVRGYVVANLNATHSCLIGGGIVTSVDSFSYINTGGTFTFDNIDIYGTKAAVLCGNNCTGIYDGCLVAGFKDQGGSRRYAITRISAATGTPLSTDVFSSQGSVINPAATPNNPYTITGIGDSNPTSEGADIVYTCNSPGQSEILLSETSRTVGCEGDLGQYEAGGGTHYKEWLNKSGLGEYIHQLTERSQTLTGLAAGTTWYYRIRQYNMWTKSWQWSEEGSFTTTAAATDYPADTDVRDGVDYNFTTETGNLTLPTVAEVELAVTYGANGIEFTGTYEPDSINIATESIIAEVIETITA